MQKTLSWLENPAADRYKARRNKLFECVSINFVRTLILSSIVCISLITSLITKADETISLATYLALANEQGMSLIYSSALVKSHYQVTHNPERKISLVSIRKALAAYDLYMEPIPGGRYLIRKTNHVEPLAAIPDEQIVSSPIPIEEVVVSASHHQFMISRIDLATFLDRDNLLMRPVVANDVGRVVTRLPGAANNGVSARAGIRGGLENETLIEFNGIKLYEPFHLSQFNSLFSVFDARTIDGISFMTGGFPASYGDSLSGVMDIQTVVPANTPKRHEIGVGLYTASYFFSGGDGDNHYLVDLRRSTIDLFGKLADSEIGTPAFSDLYTSFEHALTEDSMLSVNLLWFGDDISIQNSDETEIADSLYGNTYLWASLTSESGSVTRESRIGFVAIKNDRDGRLSKPGLVNGSLTDNEEIRVYSLEHNIEKHFDESVVEFGGSYRYLTAEYNSEIALTIEPGFDGLSNFTRPVAQNLEVTKHGQQLGLFASYKRRLGEDFVMQAGVRVDAQDYTGSGIERQVSPRLSFCTNPHLIVHSDGAGVDLPRPRVFMSSISLMV